VPKNNFDSNFKVLDTHVITPEEYEEAPEWTDEELARADLYEDGKLISCGRGRPPLPPGERKTEVKIRLDRDLVDELRASGPGWQTRLNATMRDAVFGHSKGRLPPGHEAGRQGARSMPSAVASKSLGRPRSTAAAPSGQGKSGGAGRGHRR
jgi:uncharacterized protein (DUF4415 family)